MKTQKNAFTLIEILLAVTLFSIVALSLYGVFSSGMKIQSKIEGASVLYGESFWSLEKMAKDLENAVSYSYANSYPGRLAFLGEENKVSFLIATDSGLRAVSYFSEPFEESFMHKVVVGGHSSKNAKVVTSREESEKDDMLLRTEKSFIEDLNVASDEKKCRQVMISHIKKGSLQFFYAYLEGDAQAPTVSWKKSWNKDYLPSGVRIQLTCVNSRKKGEDFVLQRDVYIPTGFFAQEVSVGP